MSEPVNVIILAAGLGTRMKSSMAKVLHRAGGLTLVEHVVRAALRVAEPGRIVVVVGHQADRVQAVLEPYGVRFAIQHEQRGTGHAALMAQPILEPAGGRVMVLYGDCPLLFPATLERLLSIQESSGAAAAVITTRVPDPTGYGRILRDEAGSVIGIVEQKAASPEQLAIDEINSGIYCFGHGKLWPFLGRIAPNPAANEIYLTDMVEALNGAGDRVIPMVLEDPAELLGINTRVELAEADLILRNRKNRELMLAGVTIERPDTVTVDVDVEVGQDTVVESHVRLLGQTRIGRDCRIGSGSVIRDSVLEERVEVDSYTLIGTSHLESDVHAGPFTRLRLDNHVESGAHIGNFVELKKTHMGAKAKAMHLAYLGDSRIGAAVNIGAGTITCNYDGQKKHQTVVGPNSFVGSNSTLVAPITIGEGSYVAAGSVITDAVEDDTLAIGRARQVTKSGWPSRRKAAQTK